MQSSIKFSCVEFSFLTTAGTLLNTNNKQQLEFLIKNWALFAFDDFFRKLDHSYRIL